MGESTGAGAAAGGGGGGGEEGDARSLGEVVGVTALRSSGEGGPVCSVEGGGEVSGGGVAGSFGGGGAGSSAVGDDVGSGRAGDSGGGEAAGGAAGGGEEEATGGGVDSSSGGGGRTDDSSLKQTHLSAASSAALSCSGPKMLSRSAIEGFRVETSASVDASEEQSHKVRRNEILMGEEIDFTLFRTKSIFNFNYLHLYTDINTFYFFHCKNIFVFKTYNFG